MTHTTHEQQVANLLSVTATALESSATDCECGDCGDCKRHITAAYLRGLTVGGGAL